MSRYLIQGMPPAGAVCVEIGCTRPATVERPLGVNGSGALMTEWVCGRCAGRGEVQTWHDEVQRWEQTGRLDQGPCWCDDCMSKELADD